MTVLKKLTTFIVCLTITVCFMTSLVFLLINPLKINDLFLIITINLLIVFLVLLIYLYIKDKIIKKVNLISKAAKNLRSYLKKYDDSTELLEEDIIKIDQLEEIFCDIKEIEEKLENAENNIYQRESDYSNILNAMTNSFFHLKAIEDEKGEYIDGIVKDVNYAGAELLDTTKEELIDKKLSEIYKDFNIYRDEILQMLKRVKESKSECIAKEISVFKEKWGVISVYSLRKGYFSIIVNNVTEIKKYAEKMSYMASFDNLTGLSNRHNLIEYLNSMVSKEEEFSVYFLDLDNFKSINDTLGHSTGDEVLKIISNKLKNIYSEEINIGRLGGDEFIIVRKGKNIYDEIKKFSLSISKMLNETIKINRFSFNTEASIGVSYYPQHATDAETLLKYADISMYEGKKAGGNKFKVFSYDMLENVYLGAKLSNAIKNKELEVYYQPVYDVNNNKIVSAEALIRWISHEEVIPPNKFIPIAKKNGDILFIDEIVIRDAARFCKRMREMGESNFIVSINISHALLKQSYFISKIMRIVEEEEITPDFLKLEITEDETIDDTEFTVNVLKELRKLGFGISLDDFGVGYSSFNHIKTLPLDTLKIDRSLIFSIENDKRTFSIIDTLIKLSHSLGLDVVCEGVEKENEMELLRTLGCDRIQGYHISKAITKSDFIKFLIKFNKINNKDMLSS